MLGVLVVAGVVLGATCVVRSLNNTLNGGKMKRLMIAFITVLLWTSNAFAYDQTYNYYPVHHDRVLIPDVAPTRVPVSEGFGADVVIYKNPSLHLDEVRIDGRYNIERRETTAYVVAKVDLFDWITKK